MAASDSLPMNSAGPSAGNDDNSEEQNLLKTKAELKIRDEGYAWVVLGAMFSTNLIMFGYNRSFGILATAMLDAYPDSSGITISLIVGLLSGCRNLFAPVIGTMSNKFGLRRSLFFGSTLYFVALVASFFCTTMTQLGFTLGAMIGFSQGIIQCCQVILVPQYFEKKLSLANGIRVASSPLGGLLFPFLISFLIEFYSLRSTLLLFGAISAHIFIFSLLMRPIKKQMKIKAIEKTDQIFKEIYYEKNNEGQLFIPNANNADNEVINSTEWTRVKTTSDVNIKKLLFEEITLKNGHLLKKRPQKKLEFKFFKNFHYITYLLLAASVPWGLNLVIYYMVIYAQTSVGLTSYEVSIMLGFESVCDFIVRLFIGWFNNKNFIPKSYSLLICLWISAAGKFFVPFATNLVTLIILTFVCTVAGASYVTSLTVMLVEDFGREHITTTWGFVRMTSGIFSFINSLIIGYILDWTGSFTVPFFVMGAGTFFCGSIIGIQILVKKLSSSEDRT
ncbi:Monocarboxylate transporter 12 [Armadillidium nasatum]|uniref:Monocarboxylate transporter 12 n=1 Tax=Armadillidium nasatum TaxID=96803 RepID=A0A5N5TGI0_9CRUS|nr:Monocarboxylate transporter 12 [Armadillidium nasatum]